MKNFALAFCGVLTDAGLDEMISLLRGNHDLVLPKAGAKDFIAWARAQGHLVQIITSDHMGIPNLEGAIMRWLEHHGFLGRRLVAPELVNFVTTPEKQVAMALKMGANVVIDPDLQNTQKAVAAGVTAIHFGVNGAVKNFAEAISLLTPTTEITNEAC